MQFKKGQSGNPAGRKPGTGHRQKLFHSLVSPHLPDLFQKAINLALNGNEAMLKLFLERILPARPMDNVLETKMKEVDVTQPQSITAMGNEIIHKVLSGELTPDQAKSLFCLLDLQQHNIKIHAPEQGTLYPDISKINDPIEAAKVYQRIMKGD